MFNPLAFASPAVLEPIVADDCGCGCSGSTVAVKIGDIIIIIRGGAQ